MEYKTAAKQPAITFVVDEVSPATEPLEESPAHIAVKEMLSGPINSCSDYHSSVVAVTGRAKTGHLLALQNRPVM